MVDVSQNQTKKIKNKNKNNIINRNKKNTSRKQVVQKKSHQTKKYLGRPPS